MSTKKKLNKKEKKTENYIENLVSASDECILVYAMNGNVMITGIKNVTKVYRAKGLLISALDNYNIQPIIKSINALKNKG